MRRMRNPPHDIQTWSKDPKKPPLYREDYTKGTKKTYTSITTPETQLRASPSRPTPRVYILKAN